MTLENIGAYCLDQINKLMEEEDKYEGSPRSPLYLQGMIDAYGDVWDEINEGYN